MRTLPVWLLALALAAFAVQTDDFIVIGVLPAIASDTGVSEAVAGQLVTVYSLVYACTAPLWAVLLARLPLRRVLLAALAVFILANLVVPWVDDFPVLVGLRVIAALSAAVVLPAALAAATTRAPEGRRGRYLATVMTGLTGAVLLGVPAGTWIGAAFGWQATFVFCGLLGVLALVLVTRSLPRTEQARTGHGDGGAAAVPERQGTVLHPLLDPAVLGLLAVTVLVVAGNLAFQTYLAPFLAALSGVTPHQLAALLVASGVGGVAGTLCAGRLADRVGARWAFGLACGAFCATMAAFALLWQAGPVPIGVAAVLLVCWSTAAWAVPTTVQALTLERVGQRAAAQAMAVLSSSVYVGAALGGVVGGLAVAVSAGLVPVAAALSAASGLVLALAVTRGRRTGSVPRGGARARAPRRGPR